MIKQIYLAGNVWSGGGNNIGEVAFVVGDKNTNRLTHLVIKLGLFDFRLLVASIEQVINIYDREKVVQLGLDETEIEMLPLLFERVYPGSPENASGDISWAEVLDRLNQMSETALYDEKGRPYTEKWNIPAESYLIREGANREAPNDQFFRIKSVTFDWDSLKIVSLTLEKGRFLPQEFDLPMEQVYASSEDWIRRIFE